MKRYILVTHTRSTEDQHGPWVDYEDALEIMVEWAKYLTGNNYLKLDAQKFIERYNNNVRG